MADQNEILLSRIKELEKKIVVYNVATDYYICGVCQAKTLNEKYRDYGFFGHYDNCQFFGLGELEEENK